MSTPRTLFDRPARKRLRAPTTDTQTEAAGSLRPFLADLQRQVLNFIVGRRGDGASDEEIQIALGMKADTARAEGWS